MGLLDAPVVQRATIGARLRAASQRAKPLMQRPWLATPAWTSGEAVRQGNVRRSAAGNLYVSLSNATCGATEPTHTNASSPSDGAALWSFLGAVQGDTADDIGAPTTTFQTSASTPSGLTAILPLANVGSLNLHGASYDSYATNYLQLRNSFMAAGSANRGQSYVSWMTDSPRFAVQVQSGGQGIGLRINDRELQRGSLFSGAANNAWIDMAFGSYEARQIDLLHMKSEAYVMGLAVLAGYGIWPASAPDNIRAVLVADSFQDGSNYGPWVPGNSFASCLGRRLGIEDVIPVARGGVGLLAKGPSNAFYTYREKADQIIAFDPDVVLIYGSTNDNTQTQAAITAEANLFLDALRAGTQAPIIWMGPVPLLPATTANLGLVDAGIAAACAGRRGVYYISPLASSPPWLTGVDNNTGFTWSNTRAFVIGGDNVHPVDRGTQHLATRWADACSQSVFPLID